MYFFLKKGPKKRIRIVSYSEGEKDVRKLEHLTVDRRELKYLIFQEERLYLLEALDRILIPDAYGGYDGYRVRSVYFDGVCHDDYRDKTEHAPEKKRIRLRVYSPEDSVAKFELKQKSYGRERKESLVMRREDAKRLLNREYEVLLEYDSEMARYAYQIMRQRDYRPVSLVEYDRRAYTHPEFNTRITMDNNLRYCDFCYDLFGTDLNFKQAMPKDETILEIKYDRFLFRQLQDILKKCNLTRKAPSKFGTSQSILKNS